MRRLVLISTVVMLSGCGFELSAPPPPPTKLDITAERIVLTEGMGQVLDANLDVCNHPDWCVGWQSSDPCVVSVYEIYGGPNNGNGGLFAWQVGTAAIHAHAHEAPRLHDSVLVTVTPRTARSVQFQSDTLSLSPGGNAVPWARFFDSTGVEVYRPTTFVSSDTTVARIDPSPGVCSAWVTYATVSGVRPGTALVVARFGELADTMRVTVF